MTRSIRPKSAAGATTGGAIVALALLAAVALPAAAAGKDRIYWGSSAGKISYANLDGSGGADVEVGEARVDQPNGVAIDSEAGTIYWTNRSPPYGISYARLDGSGGGDLPIEGAPLNWPTGVAVDPAEQRVYWGNYQGGSDERISFWDIDGNIGGSVITTGATAQNVQGVALDLAAGRIYWANENFSIAYANLGGAEAGGADVNITGATSGDTGGVAIDPAGGRIFWASHKGFAPYASVISYAALDDSGAADLSIPEGTFSFPEGVAIDVEAERIYWANTNAFSGSGSIAYANLDGSGAGVLPITGATASPPTYPAIQKAPVAVAPPQLEELYLKGPFLRCDEGEWAGDVREAQFYRAPQRVEIQWLNGGEEIPGATEPVLTSDIVSRGGSFSCRVTAVNAAGRTAETTRAFDSAAPSRSLAHIARIALVKRGRALLRLRCLGPARCEGFVELHRSWRPRARASVLPIRYGPLISRRLKAFTIPLGESALVRVPLKKFALRRVRRRGRAAAMVTGAAVRKRVVVLKKAPAKKRRAGR